MNSNAGDIASNKSNNAGALALTNTTTLNVGSFVNNGIVGASGGAATITSTGAFTGTGHFVTNGQQLNLAAGGIGSPLHIAGNNTVNANALSHNLTGVEVQSGTLKLTPTGAAATTGTLLVLGSPATAVSGTTSPVAAVSGTLNLDGTSGVITHTGNVTNSGLVRVSAGTTTVSGTISGTTLGYTPGLLEGMIQNGTTTSPFDATAGRQLNPGNFGIKLEPRMAQTNAVTQNALTGWTDGQMWIYNGYIKDNDGVFSFLENIDDNTGVWVDGINVINNSTFNVLTNSAYSIGFTGTTTSAGANLGTPTQSFGAGISLPGYGNGWHLIEIRFANGGGGAGAVANNGFNANYGFGYKDGLGAMDGADYIKPIDDGTGNLFVTPVGGKGSILVDNGTTLNVGSFTDTALVTVGTGGAPAFLNIENSSTTDALVINAGSVVTLGVPVPSAFDPGIASFDESGLLGSQGGNLAGNPVQGVPEPGSATLLFGGFLTILGLRRRR